MPNLDGVIEQSLRSYCQRSSATGKPVERSGKASKFAIFRHLLAVQKALLTECIAFAQFWQHFFEASAKVSLSGYDNVSDSASFTTESVANDTQMTDAAHGDSSKPEGASPEDSDITERNAHPKFVNISVLPA